MEEHPKVATGEIDDENTWDLLTDLLNSMEDVSKSQYLWRKVNFNIAFSLKMKFFVYTDRKSL